LRCSDARADAHMARARYDGPTECVVDAILPSAVVPDFLKYSELLDAPVQHQKIAMHASMWAKIRAIHPSLSFSQSFMEQVFQDVGLRASESQWPRALTKEEMDNWSSSISKQFRSQARAIAQAQYKPPAWLKQMWAHADGPSPCASADALFSAAPSPRQSLAASSASQASECQDYFYGYDAEHRAAWRATAGNQEAKEFAKLIVPDDGKDDEPPRAQFSSGPEVLVCNLTIGEVRMEDQVRMASGRGRLWEGEHEGSKIFITYRKDRSPILVLYKETDEDNKQLCQVHVRHWGDAASEVGVKRWLLFRLLRELVP